MQRYFANIKNNQVYLQDGDIHHLLNVMRMKKCDQIEVVDNNTLYLAEISSTSPLIISIVKQLDSNAELACSLTLFFGLAKGDKIDLVVQKATELGVSKIVLVNSKRSVVNFDNKDINKKLERFNKIAKEAAEQCHRLLIPSVSYISSLKEIKDYLCEKNYLAYEKEAGHKNAFFNDLDNSYQSASIFIGPEGGVDESEVNYLNELGFVNTSLGARILRTETAAISALSVMAYILEK